MLKIGDLSKLSQVSVKTLRYYDEVGLLNPSQVDRFTGYRYYSIEQIPRLNRILAFKDLGFSLEQIARLLDENLPPAGRRDAGFLAEWNRKVRAKRWVGFSWPEEVGGGGGSIAQQVILKEEMAKRKAPPRTGLATRAV